MPGDVPSVEPDAASYQMLDAGDGRRLERFGSRVVDRPAPTADTARRDMLAWRRADFRFDGPRGWSAGAQPLDPAEVEPWPVLVDGLTMEIRPTASGGVGLYPEHAANLEWLEAQVRASVATGQATNVLNLFGHTGLASLAVARAGATVSHVDASRGAVGWARRNAELSGLADRPVRWLVDDALGFVGREARRGRQYDGLILDPPSFGRAGRRQWRLVDELPALLAGCRQVAAPAAFVLLTAHTTGLDGDALARTLSHAFPGARPTAEPLALEGESGATLDLGWSVRHGG